VLRAGDHMVNHTFPGLTDNEEGLTATFSREVALSREDMHYLSWEHPMVTGAMDMVLSGDFGNTAFCTLKLPPLKAGTLLVEAIFILHCTAPSELQLQRFLPLTTVRVVVDVNNTDLSKVLTAVHINKLGQKVNKRSAQDLIRHARQQIISMIKRAETLAQPHKNQLVTQAAELMSSEQNSELQRLQALAQVNANIRQEEIIHLQDTTDNLQRYLQGAQLKLDAIRVALVVG
jgi:ATP-dependent helicase HepA